MKLRPKVIFAMSKAFDYFKIIGNLKTVDRTGWVRCNVKKPESVAEHMYRMAMMSWAIPSDSNLNKDKCMKIAMVHDMAESMVGDITPWCGVSKDKKQEMEEKATAHICSMVGEEAGKEMYGLWMEYETQSSPEAQFVKDLDKFEMLVQAFEYEQRDKKPGYLQDFYDHTGDKYKFRTSLVQGWCNELLDKRISTLEGDLESAIAKSRNDSVEQILSSVTDINTTATSKEGDGQVTAGGDVLHDAKEIIPTETKKRKIAESSPII